MAPCGDTCWRKSLDAGSEDALPVTMKIIANTEQADVAHAIPTRPWNSNDRRNATTLHVKYPVMPGRKPAGPAAIKPGCCVSITLRFSL